MSYFSDILNFQKELRSTYTRVRATNRILRTRSTKGGKKLYPILVFLFSLAVVLMFLVAIDDKQFTSMIYFLFVFDIFLVVMRYIGGKMGVLPHHLQIFPVGHTQIEFNSFFQIVLDIKGLLYISVWVLSVFFLLRESLYMGILITPIVIAGLLLFTSVVSSITLSVTELVNENFKQITLLVVILIPSLSMGFQEFFVDVFLFNIFGNALTGVFIGDINAAFLNSFYVLFVVSGAFVVFYLFVKFKSRLNPRF